MNNARDIVDSMIDQWTAEWPELDMRARHIYQRLFRLNLHLERHANTFLAEHGMTRAEYRFLAALRRVGSPYQQTPSELARVLLVSTGAMTRQIDQLEAAGLVTRLPDPRNRRTILVALTPAGRDRIDAALLAESQVQEQFLAGLSARECAALVPLLRKLLISLEGPATDRPPDATSDTAPHRPVGQ